MKCSKPAKNLFYATIRYDDDMFFTGLMCQSKVYDAKTKKYTFVMTFPETDMDMNEVVKGIKTDYSEITLLEDEAIIIPLK